MRMLRERFQRDDGMTTAEYAMGIVAAVAFAGDNVAHGWLSR